MSEDIEILNPPTGEELVDKVVLLLIAGHPPDAIRNAARANLGMAPDKVEPVIQEARRRLTLAAEYSRDEALGTAITRLNDCYKMAATDRDAKTAVQCQRELNRLLDLYRPAEIDPGSLAPAAAEDLAAVREYVEPLGLGDDDTNTAELVRLAVDELVRLRNAEE